MIARPMQRGPDLLIRPGHAKLSVPAKLARLSSVIGPPPLLSHHLCHRPWLAGLGWRPHSHSSEASEASEPLRLSPTRFRSQRCVCFAWCTSPSWPAWGPHGALNSHTACSHSLRLVRIHDSERRLCSLSLNLIALYQKVHQQDGSQSSAHRNRKKGSNRCIANARRIRCSWWNVMVCM